VKASLVQLAKFGTKPDPQPLWFFHLVKASLVKLAKFGNIYHSGHKILISVLAAFHKAKKPDGLAIRYGFGWVQRYLRQATWGANQPKPALPSRG